MTDCPNEGRQPQPKFSPIHVDLLANQRIGNTMIIFIVMLTHKVTNTILAFSLSFSFVSQWLCGGKLQVVSCCLVLPSRPHTCCTLFLTPSPLAGAQKQPNTWTTSFPAYKLGHPHFGHSTATHCEFIIPICISHTIAYSILHYSNMCLAYYICASTLHFTSHSMCAFSWIYIM